MQTLGLTGKERRQYEAALRSTHTKRIDVDVLDLNGKVLSNIGQRLIDGQVNVDISAEVTRSASLLFLDPGHALNFDTDSPDDGALFADRMIRIRYGVYVEAFERYVWCTIFTGPVTGLSRSGAEVQVEAQGKESLVRGSIWHPLTLSKGMRVTGAIWVLLHERGGENRSSIPEVRDGRGRAIRLPKARSLPRLSEIWATALGLARSLDRQLFYDGTGRAILRPWPSSPSYTFTTGDGGDVLSPVSVNYELSDIKNVVTVTGKEAVGNKPAVRATVTAPVSHPLAPWRLGRTGAPRYLVESIEDSEIRSNKAALRKANRVLDDRLREVVEVSFDSMPVPHLDPGDVVRVQTDDFTSTFRLRQYSIPLAPSGDPVQTVGYIKRLTPRRVRIRR